MVSLEKQPQIREITPIHLMDEDEAVHTYCPPKETLQPPTESKKRVDEDESVRADTSPVEDQPPVEKKCVLDKHDILSSIFVGIFFTGLLVGLAIFTGCFLGEALQLIKDINYH